MPLSLDFSQIRPLIETGSLILTPNSRTQKAIVNGQLISLPCRTVIQAVDARSFPQWIDQLWTELSFHQVLPKRISDLVVKFWLEKQISKETAWTLTNLSGVANKALEAYKSLVQWDLDLTHLKNSGKVDSVEVEYFIQWIGAFEDFCQKNRLTPRFLSLYRLNKGIDRILKAIPKHILMVGFEHFTPLETLFLEKLAQSGIKIDRYNPAVEQIISGQIGFSCFREEIEFAAQYAKKQVERENNSTKSMVKGKTLGIVVEQLVKHLPEVHAAFSGEFHPDELKPWIAVQKPAYNVSAGFTLAEQPLIVAALIIINLKDYQISREDLHFLKNTPFVRWHNTLVNKDFKYGTGLEHGQDCEYTQNYKYDVCIRQFLHQLCFSPRKTFSFKYLLKKIEEHESKATLQPFANTLQKLSVTKNNNIRGHINHWKYRLSLFCWVGSIDEKVSYSLNEFECKACMEFFDAMEKTKEIENISRELSYSEANSFLNQQVVNKSFQIASDHSPVQILGMLEASGLQFDELLIVGFNADNWPQKNKINPFLPLPFQRQYNMPGNSAQREFGYAKVLSAGLLKAAKKIIVTSNNESTNRAYNEATFFSQLPRTFSSDLFESTTEPLIIKNNQPITPGYEWVEDSTVNLVNNQHFGGTYLLSEYAKCPFLAIGKFQLNLLGYPEPERGIDARTKGSWLHSTMELIWRKLKSKQQLMSLDSEKINELVKNSLNSALEKYKEDFLATTQMGLINIEKNKLFKLILEWLSVEKERKNFEVEVLEKKYKLQIGSLPLQFRIDRIDRTDRCDVSIADGSSSAAQHNIELIDYKSGHVDVKDWFGVRPTEAQMPAYVLALDQRLMSNEASSGETGHAAKTPIKLTVGGLSYAQIKTGHVSQQGLLFSHDGSEEKVLKLDRNLEESNMLPVKNECEKSYQALVDSWRSTLQRISQGITTGWMPVSPKDNSACLYCDYRSICRIDESQPDTTALDALNLTELDNGQ